MSSQYSLPELYDPLPGLLCHAGSPPGLHGPLCGGLCQPPRLRLQRSPEPPPGPLRLHQQRHLLPGPGWKREAPRAGGVQAGKDSPALEARQAPRSSGLLVSSRGTASSATTALSAAPARARASCSASPSAAAPGRSAPWGTSLAAASEVSRTALGVQLP